VTRLITELLDVSRLESGGWNPPQLVDLPDRSRKIIAGRCRGDAEDRFRWRSQRLPETC